MINWVQSSFWRDWGEIGARAVRAGVFEVLGRGRAVLKPRHRFKRIEYKSSTEGSRSGRRIKEVACLPIRCVVQDSGGTLDGQRNPRI